MSTRRTERGRTYRLRILARREHIRYLAIKAWFQEERPGDPVILRCARGFITIDFRDRVFMLAGQAFIAVIPLLIVVAAALSSDGAADLAERVTERFGLDEKTASSLSILFESPPGAATGAGLIGLAIVLFSIASLGRSMRRTFEDRWRLPRAKGLASARDVLLGELVLILMGTSVALIGSLVSRVLAWVPVVLFAQFTVSVACWAVCIYLFLTRRVSLREVLPGAVFAAVAQLVAGWAIEIYLPRAISHDVSRYGAIGFSFSLVSWLIILAAVVVGVAVVSAELARAQERRAARRRPGQRGSAEGD